jgi:hypothetical protein
VRVGKHRKPTRPDRQSIHNGAAGSFKPFVVIDNALPLSRHAAPRLG